VAGFFYFAMSGDRDHSTASYSDEEATVRASAIDADFMLGTALFRPSPPGANVNAALTVFVLARSHPVQQPGTATGTRRGQLEQPPSAD
jgi:hypothetical protein